MSDRSIAEVRAQFREAAIDRRQNPRDVDLLLMHVLGKPATFLLAHGEYELQEREYERFTDLLRRRFDGEPVQYLRGTAEFYSRDFCVDVRALIPRPETEFVVDTALDRLGDEARVLDVGTGSGAIAISLKLERPRWSLFATDISFDSLTLARANAVLLQADVRFAHADVVEPFRGSFDAIVSNPPYIPASQVAALQREVRDHEPHCALTPGEVGTEVIDRLFAAAPRLLKPEGVLIFEIGYSQEELIREHALSRGIDVLEVVADLAGIPRVVVAR